ncbi:hypothetical protein [Candidatus Halobonum tyrrellensis]|uniref:Uncharacterized protein n=1 Tax=Candidatus Halobonum tyrrellensis G22 TaxID=1324957 RepID=V4HEG6_9EURY|nr:hypothetical protein [Candidatus Halobonum tyrrellensis]ESP89095.1 hypothetical protein K933_05808 [Candidatus Halobonum tyrrellensis G22]
MATGYDPTAHGVANGSGGGGRVAVILLVWGSLAALAWVGAAALGPGAEGGALGFGRSLAVLFALSAVVNAAIYAGARRLRRSDR